MTPDPRPLDARWADALRRRPDVDLAAAWTEVQRRAEAGTPVARPGGSGRTLTAAAAAVVVVVVAGAVALWLGPGGGDDAGPLHADQPPPPATSPSPATGVWQRLPDPPLAPRVQANAVWVAGELYVFGGDAHLCPPGANCVAPDDPPFRDGAALDPEAGTWRPLAATPVPLGPGASTAAAGADVYALGSTGPGGGGAPRSVLLRYSTVEDRWEELPPPPGEGPQWAYALSTVGDTVVAVATTHEQGHRPDLVLDPATGAWSALPADPLPAAFDRQAVGVGGALLLLAKELVPNPGSEGPALVLAARLDLATRTWERLPDSEVIGYGPWLVEGDLVVNPDLGGANGGGIGNWGRTHPAGGIFDAGPRRWRDLPRPDGVPLEARTSAVTAGVVGTGHAAYTRAEGLVYDVVAGSWLAMPPLPGQAGEDRPVVAAGTAAVVLGGQEWDSPGGTVLTDAWIWRPAR